MLAIFRPLFAPFERWIDALLDPKRQQATVALTLAVNALIWTAVRTLATMPRDIHADVAELYGWSLDLALGTDKHPPFAPLVTKLWFWIFPVSDLTFHLLATCNIAVALYIAFATLRRYTDPAKAVFGLALLMLVPFFNFIALKYNANSVLLPLWAATVYSFLRAFERPGWLWGALAGLGAGAAMLGKYWSITLVAALGLAALQDPRRAAFFRSAAPWLMILAGSAVLAPHLWWLVRHDFPSFAYAAGRSANSLSENLVDTATYLVGCLGYVALAIGVAWLLLRPSRAALADLAAPSDPQRRLALVIQLAMILLPAPLALLAGIRIVPLWTVPGWTLLPLVLLGSPQIVVDRLAVRRIAAIVLAFSLAMLALAPGIALVIHRSSPPASSEYASLLAGHIQREWQQRSTQPIPLVAGETTLAINTAYYLRTRAMSFERNDYAALEKATKAAGAVLVCPAEDTACTALAAKLVQGQPEILRSGARLTRPLFGIEGGVVRDMFMLVLPPR